MDEKRKLQIKLKAANLMVQIYQLALKRYDEQDADKKADYSEQIANIGNQRQQLLKRIRK